MHYLHCILVDVNDAVDDADEDIKITARERAMEATQKYCDSVFDWRTDNSAGGWNHMYPGDGVILGKDDPEKFKRELTEWIDSPRKHAHEWLGMIKSRNPKWMTKEELEEDPEYIIEDESREPHLIDGKEKYYCVIPVADIVINERFIDEAFNGEYDNTTLYLLGEIIDLIRGKYMSDSQFYSVPDYEARISSEVLEDVLEHPEKYALVYSDYHN